MIIHIGGASGSGKSTLGDKLKSYYGDKVVVKDLDGMLWGEFIPMKEKSDISPTDFFINFEMDYQKYIDDFIKANKDVNIIFVGINCFIMAERQYFKGLVEKFPAACFNLHADHKYYVDVPVEQVLKQKFNREITHFCSTKDHLFSDLLKNPTDTQKNIINNITHLTNLSGMKQETEKWNEFYKKKDYIFLPPDDIYNKIIELLKINNQTGSYHEKYKKYKMKYLHIKKLIS